MKEKLGAQDYIECDALKQFHLKEVFESAVKCVLHPIEKESTKKKKNFFLFKRKE